MNDDIQKFTMALFSRLSKLYLLLLQCQQLYSNKKTISLLNDTAGLFFSIVQEQFMDSILLGISNITDEKKTSGHKNLTIKALPDMMPNDSLRDEVQVLCEKANISSSFVKNHRNKRLAHFDETHHLSSAPKALDSATFENIENALKDIHAVLDLVSRKCFFTVLDRPFMGIRGSADELVAKLNHSKT
ncbi:MAG: hypothetical protein PHF20_02885 [Halothiobacillaceae bacterium]|nr:hypothetical protein [Halothiobacillaceae bacterium]